jgi:NADPH-dependent glutamate synthase beta subunit-like oxidoreductase
MYLVRATYSDAQTVCLTKFRTCKDPFGTKGVAKRVCVIGAGANGLATLKVLAEMDQVQSGQWSLVAFEARDNVGGIWYRS